MQIRIEIDVQPEELRRFLGLPDVSGLQEELVAFLREKLADADGHFDPAAFIRANIDVIRRNRTLQRLLFGTDALHEDDGEDEVADEPPRRSRRRSARRRET